MNVIRTELEGLVVIEPRVFEDQRGYFMESFLDYKFRDMVSDTLFVQENESKSDYGVIRGLHFQMPPFAQAKLVRVVSGKVWDVAVDIRKGSPTYGQHVGVELSSENKRQVFIPKGFAHGFSVLSETAILQYKCDSYYKPESEKAIAWNDPTLNIEWKIPIENIILSEKDKRNPSFKEISDILK